MNYSVGLLIASWIAMILFLLTGVLLIRSIIWSIVWCDIGGKYRKIRKLKKIRTLAQKISMQDLKRYVNEHQLALVFWRRVHWIYVIVEGILMLAYLLCIVFHRYFPVLDVIMQIIILQLPIVLFIIIFQFDLKKNKKYDKS